MIFSGLTDLHIVYHKSNIDEKITVLTSWRQIFVQILKKCIQRFQIPPFEPVPDIYQLIFQQDGFCLHIALRLRRLLQENKCYFRTIGLRIAYSLDQFLVGLRPNLNKYVWFHIKLYLIFRDLRQCLIETGFRGI